MSIACPHCAAANPDNSAFCVTCGKALPTMASGGPRVLSGADIAGSRTGRELQSQDLQKKMRSAFSILLTLAILQLLFGAGFVALGVFAGNAPASSNSSATNASGLPTDMAALIGIGVFVAILGLIFLGLAIWARFAPFPAAIVGLVLYCSVVALDVAMDPATAMRGVFIKIIIIAALAKAVSAGAQYRTLRRQMQAQA